MSDYMITYFANLSLDIEPQRISHKTKTKIILL